MHGRLGYLIRKELLQLKNNGIFQKAVLVRENKIYHSL